ncbi:MAG: hypothetical protein ISQ34_03380, partial [Rickettsiales bacterium]|nr:hypothetical protein [Rickettsiales bacterium]
KYKREHGIGSSTAEERSSGNNRSTSYAYPHRLVDSNVFLVERELSPIALNSNGSFASIPSPQTENRLSIGNRIFRPIRSNASQHEAKINR